MREIEVYIDMQPVNSKIILTGEEYHSILKVAYNLGLQDAVELSKLKYYAGETGYLNEESILKLKL
jgi:hypothetical protein